MKWKVKDNNEWRDFSKKLMKWGNKLKEKIKAKNLKNQLRLLILENFSLNLQLNRKLWKVEKEHSSSLLKIKRVNQFNSNNNNNSKNLQKKKNQT